jgi:AraC-like DNA-binding protein
MRHETNLIGSAIGAEAAVEDGKTFRVDALRIGEQLSLTSITGFAGEDSDIMLPIRNDMVSLVFVQAGALTIPSQSSLPSSRYVAGCGALVFQQTPLQRIRLHKGDGITAVLIEMPCDYLRRVLRTHCPDALTAFVAGKGAGDLRLEILPCTTIQSVMHQIENARLSEELRAIFLTSKAYELIALGLGRLCLAHYDCSLSPGDIERLKRAREILNENLTNPPSIIELAHEVGINDFKLKKGFKALFDTTPFGYLKECRMLAARSELLKGRNTVTAVANQVGYTNLGHFAAAFRKQFGTTPQDMKKFSQTRMEALRPRDAVVAYRHV